MVPEATTPKKKTLAPTFSQSTGRGRNARRRVHD